MVRAYRDVLAVLGARALIGASAASQIGNWLYNAALLGYVYSATYSAVWVGAATIRNGLPYVLLGPFGGSIAVSVPEPQCSVSHLADRTAVSSLTPDRRTGLTMPWSGRDMQKPGQRMTGPHISVYSGSSGVEQDSE